MTWDSINSCARPPGEGYSLTFQKDGFTKFVIKNITLGVSSTETRNATLETSVVTQSIQVRLLGKPP